MADAPIKTRMKLAEFHRYLDEHTDSERFLELIDGEIEEKHMVTHEHGLIVARLTILFGMYFEARGEVTNLGPEIRFEIPGDEENSRLPDLAVFADPNRPVQSRGAVPDMPDIAIEVFSPDDSRKEITSKAEHYLANGARQAWIVYPAQRKIQVMTLDDISIYEFDDTVDCDDILPGFKLPIAKVFNYPRAE